MYGADVIDYGWKGGGVTVIRDYLAEPVEMNGVGIVTNPPFRLAEDFIRKAIADGCHHHAWLLRTNVFGVRSRLALWRESPPSRIWISSRRLPMMHREGWKGRKASLNVAYAWFVWDTASNDNCKLGRFDWKEAA